ncbi:MAG: tetratricopeptide repeat protein [Vicinamibacterales bacterium]
MKAESIVFAIAGMCFGTILGWVLATQQASPRIASAPVADSAPAAAGARQPPPLDEARVQGLMTIIKSDPKNADALVQLANTYFDAERYSDAIAWYESSLKLDPKNVDASTDLGVSYYYSSRADEALKQFDHSLSLNPKHTKTLLNQGIVLAFGKQDLAGAETVWQKIVDMAPDSAEGQAAKRGLEGIAASRAKAAPAAGS